MNDHQIQDKNNRIDGKSLSHSLSLKLANSIAYYKSRFGRAPSLAIVCTQDRKDSHIFIKQKLRMAERIGIESRVFNIHNKKDAIVKLEKLNEDPTIDGIVLQMPLASDWDYKKFIHLVGYRKDVDGLFSSRLSSYITHTSGYFDWPNTVEAVKIVLKQHFHQHFHQDFHQDVYPINIGNEDSISRDYSAFKSILRGKRIVIFGASALVGIPQALYFTEMGSTVTIITKYSKKSSIQNILKKVDIVITGVSASHVIQASDIAKNAVVLDIGFHHSGKEIIGNVRYDDTDHLSAYTPVPGGIGPLTVYALMHQVVVSWVRKMENMPSKD